MEQRAAGVCRGGIKREADERTQVAAFPESGRLPGLRQTVYSRGLRLNVEPLRGRRRQVDPKEPWMDKQRFVLFSPVLVMVVGTFTIRLAERFLGVWAWVPWVVVYWALICVVVFCDWEGSSRAMDATNPGQVVMVGDGIRTCTTDHTYVPQLLAIAEASLRVVPVAHFRIGQSRA